MYRFGLLCDIIPKKVLLSFTVTCLYLLLLLTFWKHLWLTRWLSSNLKEYNSYCMSRTFNLNSNQLCQTYKFSSINQSMMMMMMVYCLLRVTAQSLYHSKKKATYLYTKPTSWTHIFLSITVSPEMKDMVYKILKYLKTFQWQNRKKC